MSEHNKVEVVYRGLDIHEIKSANQFNCVPDHLRVILVGTCLNNQKQEFGLNNLLLDPNRKNASKWVSLFYFVMLCLEKYIVRQSKVECLACTFCAKCGVVYIYKQYFLMWY